jgi:alkylation response protein AidB-like acyl-CoA dehydrogenase
MAQTIADRRDIDFVLHEMFHVEEFSRNEKFADFNRKTIDLVVSEARNLALKEMLPTQVIGDRQGVHFAGGNVTTPDEFKRLYEIFKEGEWVAMIEDPEWGGQGMPRTVALAAS